MYLSSFGFFLKGCLSLFFIWPRAVNKRIQSVLHSSLYFNSPGQCTKGSIYTTIIQGDLNLCKFASVKSLHFIKKTNQPNNFLYRNNMVSPSNHNTRVSSWHSIWSPEAFSLTWCIYHRHLSTWKSKKILQGKAQEILNPLSRCKN